MDKEYFDRIAKEALNKSSKKNAQPLLVTKESYTGF